MKIRVLKGLGVIVFSLFFSSCRGQTGGPILWINEAPILLEDLRKDPSFQRFLDEYVQDFVLVRAAVARGFSVSDSAVDKALALDISERFQDTQHYQQWLKERGLTDSDYRRFIRNQLLKDALFRSLLEPTDEEIRKYYEDNKEVWNQTLMKTYGIKSSELTFERIKPYIQDQLYYLYRTNSLKTRTIVDTYMAGVRVKYHP